MFKPCNVVLLSTDSEVHTPYMLNYLEYHIDHKLYFNGIEQHLYIISPDEEINKDDYWIYICPINGIDYGENNNPIIKSNLNNSWFEKLHDRKNYYKILATTDLSLRRDNLKPLGQFIKIPQIPQSFIQQFIEEYNNSVVISDVMVEYEEFIPNNGCNLNGGYHSGIKINSNDNTVVIKCIKDSWNRKEVEELIREFRSDILVKVNQGHVLNFTENWIEQHL